MLRQKSKRKNATASVLIRSIANNVRILSGQKGKKFYYRRFIEKEMRIAKRRAFKQSDDFRGHYRWRAGVEATMSEYDLQTGVKHLRIRGIKAVRFYATLKALVVNIFRATAVRMAEIMPEESLCGVKSPHDTLICIWRRAIWLIFDLNPKWWAFIKQDKFFTLKTEPDFLLDHHSLVLKNFCPAYFTPPSLSSFFFLPLQAL